MLSGRQIGRLQRAILDSFDEDALRQLLRVRLDADLEEIAAGGNFAGRVFAVISWAEDRRRTAELLDAVLAERPTDEELRLLRGEFGTNASPPASCPSPGTQGIRMLERDDAQRIDEKLDHIIAEVGDVKTRVAVLETTKTQGDRQTLLSIAILLALGIVLAVLIFTHIAQDTPAGGRSVAQALAEALAVLLPIF